MEMLSRHVPAWSVAASLLVFACAGCCMTGAYYESGVLCDSACGFQDCDCGSCSPGACAGHGCDYPSGPHESCGYAGGGECQLCLKGKPHQLKGCNYTGYGCGWRTWDLLGWMACGKWTDHWCSGCGDVYVGDYISHPPDCCDPCDCFGNWTGRRAPFAHPYDPRAHGGVMYGEGMVEGPYYEGPYGAYTEGPFTEGTYVEGSYTESPPRAVPQSAKPRAPRSSVVTSRSGSAARSTRAPSRLRPTSVPARALPRRPASGSSTR